MQVLGKCGCYYVHPGHLHDDWLCSRHKRSEPGKEAWVWGLERGFGEKGKDFFFFYQLCSSLAKLWSRQIHLQVRDGQSLLQQEHPHHLPRKGNSCPQGGSCVSFPLPVWVSPSILISSSCQPQAWAHRICAMGG